MTTAFAAHMKSLISAHFSSIREFARAVGPASQEGTTASYVNQVIRANKPKPPPMARLQSWADALGLDDPTERQWFMDLAAIAHLPPEVQPRFLALLKQVEKVKAIALLNQKRLDQRELGGEGVRKHV